MFRIVLLQILTTAVVSLLSALIGGAPAAISALLGGAACFIPNGLFALKLAAAARRPQGTDAGVFLIGEFVKVVSTIVLLALIVATYKDLVWLAMLVSIIAVLKSYVLALLIRR
jgi:ATP synthase protein I